MRCFFVVKTALKWPIMAFWSRLLQICLERNEILITFAASKVTQTKYNMKLKQLHPNVGQIAGVPSNPRKITPEDMEALMKSLREFRKMLAYRPIVVDENYDILGGNMRYQALCNLAKQKAEVDGYKFTQDIPDEWVKMASDLSPAEKMEFVIKDNQERGQWDYDKLANEWEASKLEKWNVPAASWQPMEPAAQSGESGAQEDSDAEQESGAQLEQEPERIIIVYEPEKKEALEAFLGIKIEKPKYTYEEIKNQQKTKKHETERYTPERRPDSWRTSEPEIHYR